MATVLNMVRKVRWMALAVSLGGLASGDAFGRGPYLPQIGPVPLRLFAVVSTHSVMLPPLAMSDAPPALPIHTNDLADASLISPNTARPALPLPPHTADGSVTNLAAAPEAAPAAGQTVSPRSANDLLVVSPPDVIGIL